MNDAELAWAVGLFEGEGCINTYRRGPNGTGVQLRLAMNDQDVVERFASLMDCGNLYTRTTTWNREPREQFVWATMNAPDVRRLLERMLPLFGQRRAARAREVIEAAQKVRAPMEPETRQTIRTLCEQGWVKLDIAAAFGVCPQTVGKIAAEAT